MEKWEERKEREEDGDREAGRRFDSERTAASVAGEAWRARDPYTVVCVITRSVCVS